MADRPSGDAAGPARKQRGRGAGGPPHIGADRLGALLKPLHALALAEPLRPALDFQGSTIGYGKLWSRIERVTAHLAASWDVGKGDRVATLCFNHDLQLAMLFACARLGAIFLPLNYRLAVPELATIAAHAGVRAIFHDDAHAGLADAVCMQLGEAAAAGAAQILADPIAGTMVPAALPQAPAHAHIDRLIDRAAPADPDPGPMPDDTPVLLVYTSGTTGQPKGALHTQAALLANARASWWAHGMTGDDHVLSTLPLFHVGGLCIQTLPALLAGARVTLHERFAPADWLDAVAHARPTLSLMVPATLRAVLEHPAWPGTDLSSLRGVMAGSSTIPLAYIDAFHARGVPLGQIYGATETGPVSVVLRLDQAMARPGYAGWPQPEAQVRLTAENGSEVADGEVGEIWLRAPNLMRGYWRDPAHPAFVDGWFRSGDLAHRDVDGCIEVVGRSKDMIISGGENIYPAEIENELVVLPEVGECAVVGLPDPRWGEVPVAAIVPASGADPARLQPEAIREALSARIARFKLPREVVLVDALPKSALGKVVKPRLRAMLEAARRDGGPAPAP
ncbi:class I adenylate-forming enzyme family protein [Cupriavidus sp. AU9028]|uniref:class I adenylate-forming enzyme family protein n=1 Tax=Cupriavidus sp. AU9028 TaxID=2871157 RepID=UPI001C96067B|nr:AMP-binding protein [Cupriavidus sp. AU9028]MBY4898194.1 AMP-binding protein [Cupriavidus sp. AU9028]